MSDQQIYDRRDCCTQTGDPEGDNEGSNLTLTGICSDDANRCNGRGNRNDGSRDNYIDFGGTDADAQAERQSGEAGRYEGGSRVTLKSGDTFWALSERKYGQCKHPIEAIYAANGLYPKVSEKDGKIEMTDPTYYAGKTYVLPDEKDIDRLTKQYRAKVEEMGRSSEKRVGGADEETNVKLIYGDTFSRMAQAKYGRNVPAEAFYELNGLTGQYSVKDGNCCCTKEPTYYAGKCYKLPAEKDIPELVQKYWERVGHPENCPPEYRGGGRRDENDNYGDDGETRRDRGGDRQGCNCGGAGCAACGRGERQRETGCQCGGAGCGACRGRGGRRADGDNYGDDGETQRDRGGCSNCGGAGCDACGGRRRGTGCSNCGGAGCEACTGRRRGNDGPYGDDGETTRDRGGCSNCGGAGCSACRGRGDRDRDAEEEAYEEGYRRGYRDAQQDALGNCVVCGGGGCPYCVGSGVRQEGYTPERPPQRHRGGNNNDDGDYGPYNDDGETNRDRGYDNNVYNNGDTQRNNGGCSSCGGGGCDHCRVKPRRSACCDGAGCDSCQPRRRQQDCECGGGGCDLCTAWGDPNRRRQRRDQGRVQRSVRDEVAEEQRRYYAALQQAQIDQQNMYNQDEQYDR